MSSRLFTKNGLKTQPKEFSQLSAEEQQERINYLWSFVRKSLKTRRFIKGFQSN